MIDKIIANAFVNALKEVANEVEEDEVEDENHHFDVNSEKCRNCKDFECCRMFHSMLDKIEASDIDEKVKDDLCNVLEFIKRETLILDKDVEFNKFRIRAITGRFKSLKECKNFDVLVSILNKSELKYLRSIIFKVTSKIENELNKVIEVNRNELNHFMNILRKPEVEEKRYEDMTREELLEELKKK